MDAFVEKFLEDFDTERYPADFQQDYEQIECLAHNEIGETLLVKDRQTGELCVSKCYADKSLVSRTSESSLLKTFQHAGLPSFVGEYQNEGMICVVRGYVEGTPLHQLVREAPLTIQQSIDVIVQLCDILTYLHGQNPPIIHRDIKPQNIIVDGQGRVNLIDFGISRTYDEASREDTICFGTKYYAAPEQYGFSQTDPRSDIFSLGILLYWLLTSRIDIEQVKQSVSNRRLLGIIEKCTAFDPKQRYKTAAQVKAALTGRTRRRRALAVVGASLLVLGTLLYFTLSGGVRFEEPLIEEAVRLSLGVDEKMALTQEDLLAVNEIFVLGQRAAADNADYEALVQEYANSNGSLARGAIDSLDDLEKLENIHHVALAYQNITQIPDLSGLSHLEVLDLRNNPLEAIAPFSQCPALHTLVVFDSSISDFSAVMNCPLSMLDVGRTPLASLAALDGLDTLKTLIIRDTPLQSLDGIEDHALLETIYLSGTNVEDLSPLLDLPHLQFVGVSEGLRNDAEAILGAADFEISFH